MEASFNWNDCGDACTIGIIIAAATKMNLYVRRNLPLLTISGVMVIEHSTSSEIWIQAKRISTLDSITEIYA